jgi:hypothetical protein
MSAHPLLLDFQARPRNGGFVGAAILVIGAVSAVAAGVAFQHFSERREGMELKLAALESARTSKLGSVAALPAEESMPVVNVLGAPWAILLQELEAASHDEAGNVAVLGVEPDREKGRIRIVAEGRDLPAALAYIQRLQRSRALRFPILDSHEIRTEDRDQPVRFQLSAEWKSAI